MLASAAPGLNKDKLLYAAASLGQIDIARLLLEAGANPEGENQDSQPLKGAVQNDDIAMVQLLLEKGADINALYDAIGNENYEVGPLAHAVKLPTLTMFYFLLESGANPSGMPTKPGKLRHAGGDEIEDIFPPVTPLMLAAKKGRLEPLRVLLEKGVDVRARDFGECDALMYAAERGHLDAFNFLLERGARIEDSSLNEFEKSIFISAVWGGNVDILRLVMMGRDRSGEDAYTYEELLEAVPMTVRYPAMAKLLLGPEFKTHVDDLLVEGALTNSLMAKSIKGGTTEMIDLVHARIASQLPAWQPEMRELCEKAIQFNKPEILRHLITKFSIDVDTRFDFSEGHQQHTMLMFAARLGKVDFLKLLLELGATLDLRSPAKFNVEAASALSMALTSFRIEAMDYLLAQGATLGDAEAVQEILQYVFNRSYETDFINKSRYRWLTGQIAKSLGKGPIFFLWKITFPNCLTLPMIIMSATRQ